jgi:site-specific DNA recombinase
MLSIPQGVYCAYLRKSRADFEAESSGGEDTYTKHERIILDLAKRHGITLTKIYREKPTSGERISSRPMMVELLEDVEQGKWSGVLVVEVERLARGDTMDQGLVAQAFKYSNTLIVTPMRVYNPNNPNDEEYFEFGLFMSRREYKTINRRQQEGRVGSIRMGKYVGNLPPYGYIRVKLPGKGYTLEPHPEQAPIVQLIFSKYTDSKSENRMGTALIARYLNDMNIPTARNSKWTVATVNGILRNPTYIGMVHWGSRPTVKRKDSKSRPRKTREEWIEALGLHPPIIEEEVFNRAQEIMKDNSHPPAPKGKVSNPLAGLIRCGMCGGAMVLRPYGGRQPDSLICSTQACKNVSSYFYMVEERVLQGLESWLSSYKEQLALKSEELEQSDESNSIKIKEDMVKSTLKKLDELKAQQSSLDDLLEQKVYSVEKYLERAESLGKRLAEAKQAHRKAAEEFEAENKRNNAREVIVPRMEYVLATYRQAPTPADKNMLMKSVLEQVIYTKEKGGRWSGVVDQFKVQFGVKIPGI